VVGGPSTSGGGTWVIGGSGGDFGDSRGRRDCRTGISSHDLFMVPKDAEPVYDGSRRRLLHALAAPSIAWLRVIDWRELEQ
jgi:hypothetical protein